MPAKAGIQYSQGVKMGCCPVHPNARRLLDRPPSRAMTLRSSRIAPVGIEVLLQPAPAIDVVVLQRVEPGGILRHPLAEARLEHEGERVGQLHRLELDISRVLEGARIGTGGPHL